MARKTVGKASRTSPQLVVRLSDQQDEDLKAAAEGLDLDVSNLVRMILTEHLSEYIHRGLKAKKKLREARAELESSTTDATESDESEGGATASASDPQGSPSTQVGERNIEL